MTELGKMSWEDAVGLLRADEGQRDLVRACYYDDPLADAAARFHASAEWEATRALLPKDRGKALEIGAGRGIASYALARDGWSVTAVEPDPSSVTGATAIRGLTYTADLRLQVVRSSGEQLPFAANTFELVYCRAVLHHARDLSQLCREAVRVLKPGGVLLAAREHVLSRTADLPRFLDSHPLHRFYGGEHAYLLNEYTSAIKMAGVEKLQVLNPYESEVNLFPTRWIDIQAHVARKLHVPRFLLPRAVVTLAGRLSNAPGRLFTFVGTKARRRKV